MRLTDRDRRPAALAVGLALGLAAGPAIAQPSAQSPAPAPTPIAASVVLLAAAGLDPVSYFLPGGPQVGSERFELRRGPRVWRFATAANRAAFARDPEVYAPRFAGSDAVGILDRRLVDADPRLFLVIADRLYLFRDAVRRARFLADPGLAARAEAAWPGLARHTDGLPE